MRNYDDIPFWLFGDDAESESLLDQFDESVDKGENMFMDSDDYVSVICYCLRVRSFLKVESVISSAEYFYADNKTIKVLKAYYCALMDDYDEGKAILSTIEEIDDNELMITIGDVYKEMEMYEEAILWFDRVLDGDLDVDLKGYAMMAISEVYGDMEDYDRAIDYMKYVFESDDEDVMTADLLVSNFIEYNRMEQGIEYFKGYVDDRSYSSIGWMSLGRLYNESGDNEEALEALDYAIAINDKFAMPYFFKGCVMTDLGHVDEAIQLFNTVMEYDFNEDKNFSVFYNMARCYVMKGELTEAAYYFKSAIASGVPDDENTVYIECARLMMFENNMAEAYKYIETAIDMEPENSSFHVAKAEWYAKNGDIDEAISTLESVIEKDNTQVIQFVRLSDMYEVKEEYDRAINLLMEGLGSCSNIVPLLYRLGALITIHVSDEQGLQLLEHAYEIEPTIMEDILLMYPQIEDLVRNKLGIDKI